MSDATQRPATVLVEGNLSSGKTTLLQHMQHMSHVQTLEEPVDMWRSVAGENLYSLLFADRPRWGFMFQSYVQLTMAKIHVQPDEAAAVKIMERSLHSGRHVFVENLYATGQMTTPEYAILDQWFQWLTSQFNLKPDLIVYLRCSPAASLARVRKRARPEEAVVSLHHLTNLHQLHEQWLAAPGCPVLTLDANETAEAVAEEFDLKKNDYRIFQL